jgi:predicted XRE-type DNA-binding protein
MTVKARTRDSTGNVFADLELPNAPVEQLKAELTMQITKRIKDLKLTQTVAAERLGVSQPDVSRLVHGRATGFSTDRLLELLNALAVDVDIVVRPSAQSRRKARTRVVVQQV